jgi:ribosomal protein S18 acetylase RimI-like enzyme
MYRAPMRLTAASDHPFGDLASLWGRAYADYFVPVSDDPDELRRHVELNDIDPSRSVVVHDDAGRFVGLSLLGVRGDRGWIGGFGVAVEFRRRGLSRELIAAQLEAARGAGLVSLQLEVLEQNWAQNVYVAAGFVTRRRLHGLRGTLPIAGSPLPGLAPASDSRCAWSMPPATPTRSSLSPPALRRARRSRCPTSLTTAPSPTRSSPAASSARGRSWRWSPSCERSLQACGASARAARVDAWRARRRTWWTACCRRRRCGSTCWRSRTSCRAWRPRDPTCSARCPVSSGRRCVVATSAGPSARGTP